ncbi:hypothetical protein HII28_16135 [Planctomonas sp. JC2975]|uniref:hypothetical protein n=1 Tax=Planctomonas sp. JC2975 TaxID=2729626 RepID=UPI0014751B66|nr:hypothetical protein [Planctomonas sp. JC2975]NNC13401.1 hypothetical protein [Planctomonas sp. JC2975]
MGIVTGGLVARGEAVVPRKVQRLESSILVGLLGAFALFAGVVFEWAPWGGANRVVIEQFTQTFGPFLTPFVIVAGLAVTAMLASVTAPDWLYRCLLGATVMASVAVIALAHWGVGHFGFLRAMPAIFACVIALMASLSARPRRRVVLISAGGWLLAFFISPAVFGPLPLAHVVSGYPYGTSTFFDTVIQPALAYFGCLTAQLVAAVLTLIRRAEVAAVIVLVSIPFATLSAVHGWFGRDPIYLVVLVLGYATAGAAVVIRARRNASRTTRPEDTLINTQ